MRIGPDSNPLELFKSWLADATATGLIKDPNAMTIVSVSTEGQPHARVVLCKDADADGFTFYTNYQSQKGVELTAHPRAGALFYWDPLFRQVKIDGVVSKTSRQTSVDYWRSRARGSQLSQYVSKQSTTLSSRAHLTDLYRAADHSFADAEVPCPEHWGGFILRPAKIEFWVGVADRLHDRHEFSKSADGWTYRMLYP